MTFIIDTITVRWFSCNNIVWFTVLHLYIIILVSVLLTTSSIFTKHVSYNVILLHIVITYFCFSISNMFIIIEDVDIISSRPINTTILLIAPILSLLVHVFVHSAQSVNTYRMIIECTRSSALCY